MRMMSFSLTEEALMAGKKTVTRRLGWQTLKAGDYVCAVRKAMGLKKGEKVFRLAILKITCVLIEALSRIDQADVRREGFWQMTPADFVAMFTREMRCDAKTPVTRVSFEICRCRTCCHFSRECGEMGNCSESGFPTDVLASNFCSDWMECGNDANE